MNDNEQVRCPLAPYRALDLTNARGWLCAKLLGDLGADVIKIEPPGGDPQRNVGPFYQEIRDPSKSLFWFAFNTSKRGITLDLKMHQGHEAFLKLVRQVNFIIESFRPGYMDKLGIGFESLSKINPGIIMVSISPFGQTGPHRDYRTADIVAMAMGGQMYGAGDSDRPPTRCSAPQAYALAGLHAAIGALIALYYRQTSGQGQHLDLSVQEAVMRLMGPQLTTWDFTRAPNRRSGAFGWRNRFNIREVWPCKDGEITFRIISQSFERLIPSLVQWMNEKGMAHIVKEVDWAKVDQATFPEDQYRLWEQEIGRFFLFSANIQSTYARGYSACPRQNSLS